MAHTTIAFHGNRCGYNVRNYDPAKVWRDFCRSRKFVLYKRSENTVENFGGRIFDVYNVLLNFRKSSSDERNIAIRTEQSYTNLLISFPCASIIPHSFSAIKLPSLLFFTKRCRNILLRETKIEKYFTHELPRIYDP